MLQTADMTEQHAFLGAKVAGLVDAGKIRTTVAEHFGIINAAQPQARAHATRDRQSPRQDRARRVPTRTSIGG